MSDLIETKISALIENQFPALYKTEGPVFIAFIQEYYKWMELQGNPTYHSRRIYDYRDIDETTDEFILYFKEKFLKNIQFETNTNIRQIVKHSLDLYRSKGTERGVDLLFRLVFGIGASVYYPSTDLFRLSDGKWVQPRYLEVSLNDNTVSFVNKQIRGLRSGATAFAERVVRKTVKNQFIDVIYISAIEGTFQYGEVITDDILNSLICPKVIGSLTNIELDVTGSGSGFAIGDSLSVYSEYGEQGLARVANIVNTSGIVNFELVSGGYAYTTGANVIISTNGLNLRNIQVSPTQNSYFTLSETISQPMANLHYLNATGSLPVGANLYSYYPNNSVRGSATILGATTSNSTAGELFVYLISGNISSNAIYTTGNVVSANLTVSNGFFDRTATGNLMAVSNSVFLNVTNILGAFKLGERVIQRDGNNIITAVGTLSKKSNETGVAETQKLTAHTGVFRLSLPVRGELTNAVCNVSSVDISIGVHNVVGGFLVNNAEIRSSMSSTNGLITSIGTGTGATFSVSNSLLYSETIVLSNTLIAPYANVLLNATTYGMPNVSANLTTCTIDQALFANSVTMGKITELTLFNAGQDYTYTPYVTIVDSLTAPYENKDRILLLSPSNPNFLAGELITQSDTGARGLIKSSSNATHLYIENLRWSANDQFVVTSNSTTTILGDESSATANISFIYEDADALFLGRNAMAMAAVVEGNGAISEVQVVDSGYAFQQGETVTLQSGENIITGVANLVSQGQSKGYFADRGSFLSSDKRLFDGYYWQEYSYEVRAGKQLAKYQNMLKQVMHVAGTIFFGALELKSLVNTNITQISSTIQIS